MGKSGKRRTCVVSLNVAGRRVSRRRKTVVGNIGKTTSNAELIDAQSRLGSMGGPQFLKYGFEQGLKLFQLPMREAPIFHKREEKKKRILCASGIVYK